jgi:hypothetical protein
LNLRGILYAEQDDQHAIALKYAQRVTMEITKFYFIIDNANYFKLYSLFSVTK